MRKSLERELETTRENLQATIEEVETSNEELQSTNEELMASNEELQSTNEELQSVNEELYTVNAEYQKKNDELEALSRDIDNLIAATSIGVIFVDDDLRMRRFTDAVSRVLNVAPIDVGRPLADITHRLLDIDLPRVIKSALASRRIKVAETVDEDGAWWQVRVIPLAAQWGKGDGAVITFYEITALRDAQSEAEARNKDLLIIAETTGAHVIRQKPDGGFYNPQRGWITLTGQRDEATLGDGWIEAAHPDNRKRLRRFWRDAEPMKETVLQTHVRVRGPTDSDYRHITVLSTPEFDASGRHIGWVSVLIDVEDAVQSEYVVRESEELLHTVLQVTPMRVAYLDADKRYRYANAAYEDALGVNRDAILSKRVDEVLSPGLLTQAAPRIDRALAGERIEFTVREQTESGGDEILHVQYEPDLLPGRRVRGMAVSIRDITKAFEEIDEQLQQKALIADVLARTSLAILLLSEVDRPIASASAGASALTGYSLFDLREKKLADLLPEYDAASLGKLLSRQAKPGRDPKSVKTFLINRAGDSIDVDFEIVSRPGAETTPIVVLLRDRRAASGAEMALRRRTEELSRSNRMLEVFAAAATHELTSPLRRVTKFAGLLKSDHAQNLAGEASSFLDAICDEAERMSRTIDAVVELVRLERAQIEAEPIDLNALLKQVLEYLREKIEVSGAEIEISELPVVMGDGTQLLILFRNLLANAIVYRHSERKPRITVEARPINHGDALVCVSDNGRGVPPERGSEIFLPFIRVAGAADSIGMGLALCRRIAEAHGGSAALVETSDEGSTFAVRLPAAPPQKIAIAANTQPPDTASA